MSPVGKTLIFLLITALISTLFVLPAGLLRAQEASPTPDASQQTKRLYLPAVQGSLVPLSDAASTGATPSSTVTPTALAFDQLPECPPFTPDPLVPTASPDLSDSAPRCRVESVNIVDVKALIEQGIDPSTLGIGGDPVFSAESTPSPYATPTVPLILSEEQVTTPIAAGATPQATRQMQHLYLPAVRGLSASPASTSSLATPANSQQSRRLYLPAVQGH